MRESEADPSREEGPGGRKPRRIVVVATAAFLVLALVAVGLALAGGWADGSGLGEAASGYGWRPSAGPLLLALAAGIMALLVTAGLWAALFRSAGGRTAAGECAAAWLGSNLGRYLPGKIWQLTSLAAYLRARGDSGALAFVISLALQSVVLASGVAVGLGILGGRAFGEAGPWPVALLGVVLLGALHPAVLRRLVRLGRRVLREEDEGEGSPIRLGSGALVRSAAIALGVWGLYGVGFWALIEGVTVRSPVALPAAVGIFAAGYVLGYLVLFAPGGIVVREGAIAGLLGAVAGVPLAAAATIALAARLWTTAAELLAFLLVAALGLRGDRRASYFRLWTRDEAREQK